jgi:hypothetical protein
MGLVALRARRFATAMRAAAGKLLPVPKWRLVGLLGAMWIFFAALRILLGPLFESMSMFGFHDWDSHSAYRYATVVSLKKYHELPWWNPWLGGGFPAWAYVEGATNFISPYLPLYLTLPVQVAERYEVLGATLTGLGSAYLLAGRVTRSAALRALVAVTYALNGRWALQLSVGHSWHLQYAWLPLALFFFDLSLEPGKRRYALGSGLVLSAMVYMGGIYPLPHTAILLTLYAATLAASRRALEPLRALAVASVSGIGFAAPKLFPMVELMRRYPRKIDSTEAIDLGQLTTMLTNPNQSYEQAPVAVPFWRWHEYGIYVGGWVVLAMLVGLVGARCRKTVPLKLAALVFLLLGMGAFHPRAPWTLLHRLPVFSSQHIPTRFLFPAVLMLMLVFAAFAGRYLDALVASRGWVDLLLLAPVYMVAVDIASVGHKATERSFYMTAPPIQANPEFHHRSAPPYDYSPAVVQGASLLAMFANVGVIGSYGLPALAPGAIAVGAPGYRGEAYVVGAQGGASARVTKWTPNTAVVEYEHATPGTLLVYNMNYDPGWHANGRPAVDYRHAVAIHIAAGTGRVKFSYYPRALNWGLAICALTVGLAFGVGRLSRRMRSIWRRGVSFVCTTTTRGGTRRARRHECSWPASRQDRGKR